MRRDAPIAAFFWMLFGVLAVAGTLGAMTIGPVALPMAGFALLLALVTTRSLRMVANAFVAGGVLLFGLGISNLGTIPCPEPGEMSSLSSCGGWPPTPYLVGGASFLLVGAAIWWTTLRRWGRSI